VRQIQFKPVRRTGGPWKDGRPADPNPPGSVRFSSKVEAHSGGGQFLRHADSASKRTETEYAVTTTPAFTRSFRVLEGSPVPDIASVGHKTTRALPGWGVLAWAVSASLRTGGRYRRLCGTMSW